MLLWLLILLLAVLIVVIYRADRQRLGQELAVRRLRTRGAIMAILYLGLLGLLLGFERNLIYHPQTAAQDWSPPNIVFEELSLKSSTGDTIHAWWCPQPCATVNILFSHGNAGNLANHAWIILAIRRAYPCNVLIYDYPGFGKSSGKPSEPGCYASAQAAYQWLRDVKKVPSEQIILMGQSLGCAMACELASKQEHRCLILLSPFTTIRDRGQELFPIFPVKWLMGHLYDNRSKLKNYHKPLLIGHSTHDEVIPFHHAQQLYDTAASSEKTLHTIPGKGHNDLVESFFVAMRKFLEKQ